MNVPRSLATLLIMAVMVSGCSTTSVRSPEASSESAGEPLVIAMDTSTPPLAYAVSDSEFRGMEVEFMKAVAAQLDRPLVVRPMPFSSLIDAVAGNEVDAGVSGIFDTPERRGLIDFVDYSTGGSQWLVPAGSTTEPETACGLRVAAVRGSQQLTEELPARSQACTDAGQPPLNTVDLTSNEDAPEALLDGAIDAFVSDSPVTRYLASRSKGRLSTAGAEYDVQKYGIAVPKDSDVTDDLRAAVDRLQADGTLDRLKSKWGIDK